MKTLPPFHKLVNLMNLMKICDPGDSPTHEQHLAEEQPDVQLSPVPARPVAATPAEELDGSIEDAPADVAGGAVADAIRDTRLTRETFGLTRETP